MKLTQLSKSEYSLEPEYLNRTNKKEHEQLWKSRIIVQIHHKKKQTDHTSDEYQQDGVEAV